MKIVFLRQPYGFIKRADKNLKEKIKGEILKIQKKPFDGYRLRGISLREFFCHHFVFIRVNYRIVYKIAGNLIIVTIATRENFYKDLRVL